VKILEKIKEKVLYANNFSTFNPMQKLCVDYGFDKSVVVSAPTASGKTIIAELFALHAAFNKKTKTIYTCPLRALASEHYRDFKKKYPELKFALATGDLDSESSYLKAFDVIFTTYEKLASLLRHKTPWISSVGCLIIDEIHEIDSDRGPVIEVGVTQLRFINPQVIILGLSATIPNSKEIANWLDAKLIESDFRPTILKEGVMFNKKVHYKDGSIEEGDDETILKNFLKTEKQALVFMNSRKSAEDMAKKLALLTHIHSSENFSELEKASEKILNALDFPTTQCRALSEVIKSGAAFHHAGLISEQRTLIEELFKAGKLKALSATPTLAAGVNTPADIVLIPTAYRYTDGGMQLISMREYKQMSGRSGRPKYSTEGKSILVAKNANQKEVYSEKYLFGEMEEVYSQLGLMPTLRTHILGLIATDFISNEKTMRDFFSKTFYATQYQNREAFEQNIMSVIKRLEEINFVKIEKHYNSPEHTKIIATPLGKRVSDLFIDPETAFSIISSLSVEPKVIGLLYTWANCIELKPLVNSPKDSRAELEEEYYSRIDELATKEPIVSEEQLNAFMLARACEDWINEKKDDNIFHKYNIAPGQMRQKNQSFEWLAYSTAELSKLVGKPRAGLLASKLEKRIANGVKEELLILVELRGVGRARAREIFNLGLKTINDVKNNPEKIEAKFGKKLAEKILSEIKGKSEKHLVQSQII
jgi:helicase